MTIAAAPPGLQPEEFDRIEGVLLQTTRGRLFLAECARRTMQAERARILEDIDRLLASDCAAPPSVSENAADAAAGLLDLAWSLRENGRVDGALSESIEALARTLEGVNWVQPTPVVAPRHPVQAPPRRTTCASTGFHGWMICPLPTGWRSLPDSCSAATPTPPSEAAPRA